MSFFDSFKNQKINKEIDKMTSDIYSSASSDEIDEKTIRMLMEAGFSQQQAKEMMKSLKTGSSPKKAFSGSSKDLLMAQNNKIVNTLIGKMKEVYDLLKEELVPYQQFLQKSGRSVNLSELARNDIIELVTFLSVLKLDLGSTSVNIINSVCSSDNISIDKFDLYRVADKLNIMDYLNTKKLTKSLEDSLSSFSDKSSSFLNSLNFFQLNDSLSIIYAIYSQLLMGVCQIMENNGKTQMFIVGLNNYLYTQYSIIESHLVIPKLLENFYNAEFKYLERINKEMNNP